MSFTKWTSLVLNKDRIIQTKKINHLIDSGFFIWIKIYISYKYEKVVMIYDNLLYNLFIYFANKKIKTI